MLNRYLRLHAGAHGFHLNSHFLYCAQPGAAGLVPYERPTGIDGGALPDGVRTVRNESDVFALLGVRVAPPHARNA
jgi:hypothetical protein